jgi:hypothetical protein
MRARYLNRPSAHKLAKDKYDRVKLREARDRRVTAKKEVPATQLIPA